MKLKVVGDSIGYVRGGNKGAVTYFPQQDKPFLAVTATKSNWYKTQKGAENFMAKNLYVKAGE